MAIDIDRKEYQKAYGSGNGMNKSSLHGAIILGRKKICNICRFGFDFFFCILYTLPRLLRYRRKAMAPKNISKNARRSGAQTLTSRWGGEIKMKSVFENGKLKHVAYCEKTKNEARKPRDLM